MKGLGWWCCIFVAGWVVLLEGRMVYGAEGVDAAEVVREVRRRQAWIDEVASFRVRATSRWERSERDIERRKAELKKQLPHVEPTAEIFSDLIARPRPDLIDLAFDRQRLYLRRVEPDRHDSVLVRVWDGSRGVTHEKNRQREYYALENNPFAFFSQSFLNHLAWPRGAPHRFWWVRKEESSGEESYGRPEDFRFVRRQNFRGVECNVVETDVSYWTLYLGVTDGHLYGVSNRAFSRARAERDQILMDLAREAGREVKTMGEYSKWEKSLPAEQRPRVMREYLRRARKFSVIQFVNFYSDWRELGPGRWIPMRQGYDVMSDDPPEEQFVAATRTIELMDVQVDRPLPAGLFTIEFKEGVEVHDWGHDPPLSYKYKKRFSPEEWQAILDEAAKRRKDQEGWKAALDRAVGKEAPAFGAQAEWINSMPLTWKELTGKVVILDFWATWCAPCRNQFPALRQMHDERGRSGIVVIGIHASGTPREEVEKFVKEHELTYPICIDPSPEPGRWMGPLFEQYGIGPLPQVIVVDARGNVAMYGTLGDAMRAAWTLVEEAAGD